MELDVTKNIHLIEKLKSRLLEDVSRLYGNMLGLPSDSRERMEILADITLTASMLAERLGQGPEALEEMVVNQLRLRVLEESNPLCHTYATMLKHYTSNGRGYK